MPQIKHKISRRCKNPSVWAALNEPIAYPTEKFTRPFFAVAFFIILFAWMIPYWGTDAKAEVKAVSYSEPAASFQYDDFEAYLYSRPYEFVFDQAVVAGASVQKGEASIPEWYPGLLATGADLGEFYSDVVAEPFGKAAYEVLDISEPVSETLSFYSPGVEAVWNAWLDLMVDPEF